MVDGKQVAVAVQQNVCVGAWLSIFSEEFQHESIVNLCEEQLLDGAILPNVLEFLLPFAAQLFRPPRVGIHFTSHLDFKLSKKELNGNLQEVLLLVVPLHILDG